MLNVNKMVRKMGVRKARRMGITPEMQNGGGARRRSRWQEDEQIVWGEPGRFPGSRSEGTCFRLIMYLAMIAIICFLGWLKWDMEMHADQAANQYLTRHGEKPPQQASEHSENPSESGEKPVEATTDATSRNDTNTSGQVAVIGVADFHAILNVTERSTSHDIRRAYEKAKTDIESGSSQYQLAEVKQAYDVLASPEAKAYVALYGQVPPEFMKRRLKNTHGGWGIELGLGRFRNVLILAWLDYINNIWVEVGLFVFIVAAISWKLFSSMDEIKQKLQSIEDAENEQKEEVAREKQEEARMREELLRAQKKKSR